MRRENEESPVQTCRGCILCIVIRSVRAIVLFEVLGGLRAHFGLGLCGVAACWTGVPPVIIDVQCLGGALPRSVMAHARYKIRWLYGS